MSDEPKHTPAKTSHDHARELHRFADWLLTRPAFKWPVNNIGTYLPLYAGTKKSFVEIAKALGTGAKKFTDTEVRFEVTNGESRVSLWADRNVLCTLIRPAQWSCDPLLDLLTEDPAQ